MKTIIHSEYRKCMKAAFSETQINATIKKKNNKWVDNSAKTSNRNTQDDFTDQ